MTSNRKEENSTKTNESETGYYPRFSPTVLSAGAPEFVPSSALSNLLIHTTFSEAGQTTQGKRLSASGKRGPKKQVSKSKSQSASEKIQSDEMDGGAVQGESRKGKSKSNPPKNLKDDCKAPKDLQPRRRGNTTRGEDGITTGRQGRAGSTNLVDRISNELKRGYECMVCMSEVKHYQSVWSCKVCFRLFHLNCLHQWIKQSCPHKLEADAFEWRCPGCQYTYIEQTLPKYMCFCGRTQNPAASRQSLFSCEEPCSRGRKGCEHPCVLQCHPGSCPPCTVLLSKSSCFCGSEPADGSYVKCGDPKATMDRCNTVCHKLLNCGVHRCEEICHGECAKCPVVVTSVACSCGAEKKDVLCGHPAKAFTCGKSSSVAMDCGVHNFERICGDLNRACPLSPNQQGTRCACRQHTVSPNQLRVTCSDPISRCDKTCTRTLACGHTTELPCMFESEIASFRCSVAVSQSCRCGKAKRTVPCYQASQDEFTCTQPCRTWKTCTKCKCDHICCPDMGRRDYGAESHICFRICGKHLNCGIHRCDEIHHLGNCGKCRVIVREPLNCNCGKTVVNPPFSCGTTAPVCRQICNKELPCGHRDLSMCHTDINCAPCTILVSKPCAGGHQTLHQIPCYAENVSCNLRCGKLLSCGRHMDKTTCHAGDCQPCAQECGDPLPFCEHVCLRPCNHSLPACGDEPCKARVLVTCQCGLRTEEVQCRSWSGNPSPSIPTVPCSSECAVAQRQALLRQAFKPEVNPEESEQYSGDLVSLAEKNDKFIRLLDATLMDAVEARTRSLHLPPSDQLKRYLTLEYCQLHYRLEAETLKEGEGLHVVVHFVPGESRTPNPTLSAILDMTPSQALQYTVDFAQDGPKIHLFDVARGFGRLTIERVNKELKSFVGAYRTRRGEKFDLFLDFFDANKAVAAFRKLKSVSGLEQCQLVNVALFQPEPRSPKIDS